MDASRHQRQLLRQLGHPLRRVRAASEEQARPLQPLLADRQALFEIPVIVLVRFRVNNHGEVHPAAVHALEQVLGSGCFVGLVRSIDVVREPRVVLASEAVQVRIDHRHAIRSG
jgi:hypothetical protein